MEAERKRFGDMWQSKQECFYQCLESRFWSMTIQAIRLTMKKHEDFEKSLAAQEEKGKYLEDSAEKLITAELRNY